MGDDILNMSLDDIIKSKGSSDRRPARSNATGRREKGGRGRGGKRYDQGLKVTISNQKPRRGGGAGSRAGAGRVLEVQRGEPQLIEAPRNLNALEGSAAWEHDLYEGGARQRAQRLRPSRQGFKLLVTNLDFKVSDDDIRELFENCGTLLKAGVLYDRSGRSEEAAEVIFQQREDALSAMKRYNNLALDNKPMSIELVEGGAGTGGDGRTLASGIKIGSVGNGAATARAQPRALQQKTARPIWNAAGDRAPRAGGGRPQRQARGRGSAISAADFDKDLDSYMAE